MLTDSGDRNPVEALAEEFLERKRRGDEASPEDYARDHPELAEEILTLFPALLMMEDLGGDSVEKTGSVLTGARSMGGTAMGRLGEFRLLREVGRGGMGVVYEAEQESLGRRVALKVLPSSAITDTSQLRRFEREARSAARLHHTNIVPVFGVGHHEGTHFYVMQLIQGQGLNTVLIELRRLRDAQANLSGRLPRRVRKDDQPAAEIAMSLATGRFVGEPVNKDELPGAATLPWSPSTSRIHRSLSAQSVTALSNISGATDVTTLSETDRRFAQGVARIGVQVAEALAYAHGQGILHRDIKPSNLLLDREGNVWVADFGLAKAVGSDDLTHTGDVVGTLRYMAPERFQGDGDARADIYALGLTLYELLALRPAYPEPDRTRLIHQVTQDVPPRLRRLNRRVPADLETIIHKAIAREPGQRYATSGALAEDLRRFIEGRPILARRVAPAERAWRWCKRNPAVSLLTFGIALSLVLGTIVATAFAIQARLSAADARNYARLATEEAERTRKAALRATAEARRADREAQQARAAKLLSDRRLYLAQMTLAHRAWQEGQMDLVFRYLQAYEPKRSEDIELRGFEWYYLKRLGQYDLRTLRGHTNNVMGVAFSPDGSRIASASEDGSVKLWEVATGREIRSLRGHLSNVLDVAYSPDGRHLASAGMDKTVRLWDALTGEVVMTLQGHSAWVLGVAYSPDGRHLASCSVDGTVRVWDTKTGQIVHTPRGHGGAVWGVVYSPDGRRLASASADLTVKLWDTSTGKAVFTLRGHGDAVWGLTYSPDGRTLASASGDRSVKLWNSATGQEIMTLRGHSARVLSVAFSPDGHWIASCSADRTIIVWDTATGRAVNTLRGHEDEVWGVAFSPDGRRLASVSNDRTVKLWDISAGEEVRILSRQGYRVLDAAFSPDGRRLASVGDDRTVRIWDVATGLDVLTLHGHLSTVVRVVFSRDGLRLASASEDGTVRLWDAATGRELLTLRGDCDRIYGVALSPDGLRLASAGDDRIVRLWDVATGRQTLSLVGHEAPVVNVAFSPDGHRLVSGGMDHTVRLWDTSTGQQLLNLRGHSSIVTGVAFSSDGRHIASSSGDGTVRLWDATAGQELLVLRGHAFGVLGVTFSADGRRLATAGDDLTVRLWDVSTGQEILTLRGHTEQVMSVAFSADDRQIASASWDHTVRLWDATPPTPEVQELREARGVVEALFARSLPTADVLARIRHDSTLGDPVRRQALDLAKARGESLIRHDAEVLVQSLYDAGMLRADVLDRLCADRSLGETVLRSALQLAKSLPENAGRVDESSRQVLDRPGGETDAYRLALRQAETACRLIPDDSNFVTTLGLAQYRLGFYHQALATLGRANLLSVARNGGPSPKALAFLALVQHGLGRTEQARAGLNFLRETLKTPAWDHGNQFHVPLVDLVKKEKLRKSLWAQDLEVRAFVHEAELIELDLAFPPDPFGP